MNFKNISAWSIRNPVVPIVMFIALTLAGLVSFMRMDVQDNPDIEFPVVIATISQPGAAPTEIENQITQIVESSVRTLPGVRSISSNANEGSSTTVVEFEIGTDVDQSNRIQRRAAKTGAVTPKGLAVVEGLNGTEQVVLRAGGFLNPGERVRPQRQAL